MLKTMPEGRPCESGGMNLSRRASSPLSPSHSMFSWPPSRSAANTFSTAFRPYRSGQAWPKRLITPERSSFQTTAVRIRSSNVMPFTRADRLIDPDRLFGERFSLGGECGERIGSFEQAEIQILVDHKNAAREREQKFRKSEE